MFYQAANGKEALGRFVGVCENKGDALTYWVLTDDTQQVIARSAVRTALDPSRPNLRLSAPASDGGEFSSDPLKIATAAELLYPHVDPSDVQLPRFSPDDLLKRSFVRELDDGQKVRATVVRKILDKEAEDHQNIKFLLEIGEGGFDEIIGYGELSQIFSDLHDAEAAAEDRAWVYKAILDHQGPLRPGDPRYKGSSWNVLIQWEDGTETWEPLDTLRKDDPVACTDYAIKHGLLNTEGWKSFRRLAKNRKKLQRMINQARMKSERHGPIYQFGVRVPRNYKEAIELDKANGNTKWKDAINLETTQLFEYDVFEDRGKAPRTKPPSGYKKIRLHFVFAVKHDLRHKARLVAGGHLTPGNNVDSFSGVVSLKSMRIAILIGEMNGLNSMVGDVGNAYLEAYTKERVYIVAGPEFGELEGHILIIVKALYGLRTSGARYHEKFADTMRDMGFTQCKADADVWMRDAGNVWEYVCVYVDDLYAIMKEPQLFFDELTTKYKYKLKGVGKPTYHLGGDFFRDPDGTFAWGCETYIKKIVSNYKTMFGEDPKEYKTPLESGDHPELDTSPEITDPAEMKKYQSIIGALQWAIT
ncbi:MAG: reverse transcriptase domain-containing protein, partial [Cyanobacteria bacterium J06582_2]